MPYTVMHRCCPSQRTAEISRATARRIPCYPQPLRSKSERERERESIHLLHPASRHRRQSTWTGLPGESDAHLSHQTDWRRRRRRRRRRTGGGGKKTRARQPTQSVCASVKTDCRLTRMEMPGPRPAMRSTVRALGRVMMRVTLANIRFVRRRGDGVLLQPALLGAPSPRREQTAQTAQATAAPRPVY
ncbi:hypothetical protein LY76DRAFT_115565 [Colletotrichum caudatum]|nr:hypothetical protein LY76DRAFT_115565 [Colletotrichum caudatum]